MTMTITTLRDQTYPSAERNVREVIDRQLEMSFSTPHVPESLPLDEIISSNDRERLGEILAKEFPFFPAAYVNRAKTIRDLIFIILQEAGCSAQADPVQHRTNDSSLFAHA